MTSLFVVGDLQGCGAELDALLVHARPDERIVFLGDLVNRGPRSLATLRRVRALGNRAVALLGNHDLHLLAAAAGLRPLHRDDTLADILEAPDAAALIDWVRHRPLAHREAGALFVHAGVLPPWTVAQTLALADEVAQRLRAPDHRDFLARMYGNQPDRWDDALQGDDRLRCIVNALTRVRLVDDAGTIDFKVKEGASAAPPGWMPWFDHPARRSHPARGGLPILFGHWSTLGLLQRDDAVCLDTGCVWGGRLSAMRWPERTVVSVPCAGYRLPGRA
jgi:bis(5'-nucleosyl)-tetraphosphatase (symmetrical)